MKNKVKIAIIQDAPVHFNLAESLQKVEQHIATAAKGGAELVVFGETWLSGYPVWLDYCTNYSTWGFEPMKKVFARMYQNSLRIPSTESERLSALCRKHSITLVIGVNEAKERGIGSRTIYNSLLIFDKSGELVNHHRKLMPTYTEKLLYGHGDGHGLRAVDTDFGRLGGLICWEHVMPLTRQAMHREGDLFHIALWPNVHEMLQVTSRSYAFEGRCFVIAVGQTMRARDIPAELEMPTEFKDKPDAFLLRGGSCIIGPDGMYLLEPQFETEGIIFHEIDNLDRAFGESMALDVTGHYNRTDVFNLDINKARKE